MQEANRTTQTEAASKRSPPPRPPRLLDQVREAIRVRHFSIRTEHAYVDWITRYILFHDKRHPKEMGAAEINRFLSHLASDLNVAASTQNQALSALVFLYRHVLKCDPGDFGDVVRAKRPQRLPVILSPGEVQRTMERLTGTVRLMCIRQKLAPMAAALPSAAPAVAPPPCANASTIGFSLPAIATARVA